MPNQEHLAYVFLGVEPEHPNGATGVDQPQPFILAQSLGVHVQYASGNADDVKPFHFPIEFTVPTGFVPVLLGVGGLG